jgi:cysteine desulfurase
MQKQADHLTIGAVDSAGTLTELPATDTDFASIQFANNELGTIQDMPKIASYCKEHHILLHTDAVQAFPKCEIDLSKLPVDLLSLSAHKFHGPTGVGALFLRTGVQAEPLLYGGNGKSLFAGTENLAGIVGMGAAAEVAYKQRQAENAHKKKLLALLKDGIQKQIPNSMILSPAQHALPDLLSVCFPGLESEGLLALLDLNGICASAGSACHAGEKQASHVLQAIGLPEHLSHSVIRFSIGSQNTEQEILQTIAILQKVTTQLYAVS